MTIHFSKYHGAGNDFIIIDDRKEIFDISNNNLVKNLCDRRFGIGADGLMILRNDNLQDFRMIYFNSDGYEGTMCGNGGRCITSFASSLGLISDLTFFLASDGTHEAKISGNIVNLKMKDNSEINKLEDGYFVNSGSPHFVCLNENPFEVDINTIGKDIRSQHRFSPNGVNVNFISVNKNIINIATFERGVEAETLSCGTGSVASAVAVAYEKPNGIYEFNIKAKGGNLVVKFEKNDFLYQNVWLSGPAEKVFEGKFEI
jgi:diaminopimelate epimerase